MVSKAVITCLRVLQNVKTRFRARCVFSSCWKEDGHGIELVMGAVKEDALRVRAGGPFALGVRGGLVPPS